MTPCPRCARTLPCGVDACPACGAPLAVLDRQVGGPRERRGALAELVAVVLVAFGPALWRSTEALLAEAPRLVVDDDVLLAGIVEELATLLGVGVLLALRGWRLGDLRPAITWRLTGLGLALAVLWWMAESLIVGWLPPPEVAWEAEGLSAPVALAFSLVNGAWEELLLVGYVFRAAERLWSTPAAFTLSLVLRVAYHLYQGLAGALAIAAFGALLGVAYLLRRRLWPLVVAHVLADAVGLLWLLA